MAADRQAKKRKNKISCSRGIQSHSYKVVGNVSGMFRSSCSFRGDALYCPKRGGWVGSLNGLMRIKMMVSGLSL